MPPFGIVHMHGESDDEAPALNRSFRREQFNIAARSARETPMFPPRMGAAVIVGHGSEDAYVRRAVRRIVSAVRQLPASGAESWVAVYWSNGAPTERVHGAVPWSEIPEHIVGIILVGCGVAFPHAEIHCFTSVLYRGASEDDPMEVRSANPGQDDFAALVLRMFEQSSGVRPTIIEFDKTVALLRDGQRPILPFNLVLARDPRGLDRATFPDTRSRTF